MTSQLLDQAIIEMAYHLMRTSIREDRIIVEGHSPELALALFGEADDSADNGDTLEFWGTLDGNPWRVHLKQQA